MLSFDDRHTWWPGLADALRIHVGGSVREKVATTSHECYEDACDLLLSCSDREAILDAVIEWLRPTTVEAYHGSRLTDAEVESIRANGLQPLAHANRKARIDRALSPHPRWPEVRARLDRCLHEHGPGEREGRREGQVHLTLSRRALIEGFNHYLAYGSEFDQHVAQTLLGCEGLELLRKDGRARVIAIQVPGWCALDAAHPDFTVDDLRRRGEIPNLAREFLRAWSWGLANPELDCGTLNVDCSLRFSSAVPAAWIIKTDRLTV